MSDFPRRAPLLALVFLLTGLGLSVLSGCGGSSEAAIDPTAPRPLVLQPQVGMTYETKAVTDQVITLNVMGQEVDIFQTITSYIEFRVDSLAGNGDFIAQATHQRFQLEQEGPGTFEEYDSDDPDAEPESEISFGMQALAGVPFKVRVTPTGEVEILDGMDAVYNNMMDMAGTSDPAQRDTIRQVIAEELPPEEIARDLVAGFYLYRSQPVAPGSTWTVSNRATSLLPLRLEGTATLDSASLDSTYLSLDAQLESLPDTSGDLPANFENARLSGTATGTVTMDRQSGFTLRMDLDQSLSGDAEMSAEGQSFPVSLSIETKATVDGSITRPSAEESP